MAISDTTASTATSLMGGEHSKKLFEDHMKYSGFSRQNISCKAPVINMYAGIGLIRLYTPVCVSCCLPSSFKRFDHAVRFLSCF